VNTREDVKTCLLKDFNDKCICACLSVRTADKNNKILHTTTIINTKPPEMWATNKTSSAKCQKNGPYPGDFTLVFEKNFLKLNLNSTSSKIELNY